MEAVIETKAFEPVPGTDIAAAIDLDVRGNSCCTRRK
jgi:hypothetical protein